MYICVCVFGGLHLHFFDSSRVLRCTFRLVTEIICSTFSWGRYWILLLLLLLLLCGLFFESASTKTTTTATATSMERRRRRRLLLLLFLPHLVKSCCGYVCLLRIRLCELEKKNAVAMPRSVRFWRFLGYTFL